MGLREIKVIFFILLLACNLMDTSCNKVNTLSQGTSAIKVIGNREDNNFLWFATDKAGNIYTIENQDKAIFSNDSVFVIKTDAALNVIWRKPVFMKGGLVAANIMDIGEGLIINLNSASISSYPPLIIVRIDYDGDLIWSKTLPMSAAGWVAFGSNQTCVFMGYNTSGAPFACETDTGGNLIWTHTYPVGTGTPDQTCRFGTFTSDGSIVLLGFNYWSDSITGGQQARIIKTDPNGSILWSDTIRNIIPGVFESAIQFLTCAESADGHIVCTLGASLDQNNYQTYAVIYDKDGKNRKITDLNTPFYFISVGSAGVDFNFYKTADNGYFIGGVSKTSGTETHYKIFIAKFDANLNKLWTQTYGGNYDLLSGAVIPYNDGGFLIGSTTAAFGKGKNGNDLLLMRTDANGNLVK